MTRPVEAVPREAFVGLGSNVGDRRGHLEAALIALRLWPGVLGVTASPLYKTEAHVRPGDPPGPEYLNAAARVVTTLAPEALLAALLAIERGAGRARPRPWAPRTLDLDLLLYANVTRATPELTLPHPRLALRRFVLAPLADLAPERVVPGLGRTVAELLARCPDTARCIRWKDDGAV